MIIPIKKDGELEAIDRVLGEIAKKHKLKQLLAIRFAVAAMALILFGGLAVLNYKIDRVAAAIPRPIQAKQVTIDLSDLPDIEVILL